MDVDRFTRLSRIGAAVLMVPVGIEMIRYTYRSFRRAINFCFAEPERWNTHWMLDEGGEVLSSQRVAYFTIWAVVILASTVAYAIGLYLLNRCRQGHFFNDRTASTVQVMGGWLVFSLVLDTIFGAVDAWLITLNNAIPRAIAYLYDPTDLKIMVLGGILFLFGWVMREAIRIEQENQEFV